jgi:alkylated DNA repair dioxygenase AlkB
MRLAFSLDHRAWQSLLAEEWWPIRKEAVWVRLGIDQPVQVQTPDDRIEVIAWVDPRKLPRNAKVMIWRKSEWVNAALDTLKHKDKQLVWPGPIPLFAITHFTVTSQEHKLRLQSMAQGFANLTLPEQEICIEEHTGIPPRDLKEKTPRFPLLPPEHWNALRGAAAMAVWAVPKISPWLEKLCDWFGQIHSLQLPWAPWLISPPWLCITTSNDHDQRDTLLWRAMLDVFMNCNIRESWQPSELLEAICDKARILGVDPESLDSLLLDTASILDDRRVIDPALSQRDPVGLVLQLILLRPKPEQFITWKDDLRGIPPAVWWSAAVISGLIMGYRNLDVRFRSHMTTSRLAALLIWKISEKDQKKFPLWDEKTPEFKLELTQTHVKFRIGDEIVLSRPLSNRGLWFSANYNDPQVLESARNIAQREYPEAIRSYIDLSDLTINYSGSGKPEVNESSKQITSLGKVIIDIDDITPTRQLDSLRFKNWIAAGSILGKLISPPLEICAPELKLTPTPEGLSVISEFIDEDEELSLIKIVDSGSWLGDLRRRVQHYGWKYDYGSRSIQPSSYLGPLPAWAEKLAFRLLEHGLVTEKPDQLIVNEYVEGQGISKHIDCPSCFRGTIVTISLNEAWSMTFRRSTEKYETILPRRSAACMTGSSRYEWTHEIPQRKSEAKKLRGRRISLTFRKVNIN